MNEWVKHQRSKTAIKGTSNILSVARPSLDPRASGIGCREPRWPDFQASQTIREHRDHHRKRHKKDVEVSLELVHDR
jgi:hypothetical protein